MHRAEDVTASPSQYVSKMAIAFEALTCLKEYRTPQMFRAFARVYILLLGGLYGPYYVSLGDHGPDGRYIGLPIAFAICMQLAMSGLFQVLASAALPCTANLAMVYGIPAAR